MNKLHSNLEREICLHPDKVFNVIITLKEGSPPDNLGLSNYKVLMENIITSGLGANQLHSLSEADEIVAIELDEEMGAL